MLAVSGTKTGGDFTITGGGDPTVSSYAISGSTVTLTLGAAIPSGSTVTLAYAKNGTEANRITDTAGNELAAVTSKSVTGKSISVSAVSTDDYINDAEDENALTISGTSTGLTSGTTITVGVDGSGTDISGKTGTTDSDGDWSVSLTSDEVKALDASSPDADGEDLTITATSTGASSGTRTVTYDPTAPGISTVAASGTTLTVTMDESVYAATVPTMVTSHHWWRRTNYFKHYRTTNDCCGCRHLIYADDILHAYCATDDCVRPEQCRREDY